MPPRVSRYMSDEVVVVRPDDNLAHVRNLMLRYGVSRVIVVDRRRGP